MLTLVDPDHALQLVLEHTPPAQAVALNLARASGLLLAETVVADRDYPPFDRATMDGYAVRLADRGRVVPVGGEVAAGAGSPDPLPADRCVAIMTGAPCPAGTEAVVPVEQTRQDPGGVVLPGRIERDANIVRRGTECRDGAPVARDGTPLSPVVLAAVASVGRTSVRVLRPPSLTVIATGDELVPVDRQPGATQIRNGNGPMLAAAARRAGLVQVEERHAGDSLDALDHALAGARSDIVALSGGVSAGRYDLVPDALRRIGAELILHKVKQRPGKPMLVARREDTLYFGLPGNPVSSYFCFQRYVAAAIRRFMGRPQPTPDRGHLSRPLHVTCRQTFFVPARLERTAGGRWTVEPRLVGSGNIFACVDTQAFFRLPPGAHALEPGAEVTLDLM